MIKRYLGQLGEDSTLVEFKVGDFGKTGNEYDWENPEDSGKILTAGAIPVAMPYQVGKISYMRLQNDSATGPYQYSMRLWFFNDQISTQTRAQFKALTSADMDKLIGFVEIRCQDYPGISVDFFVYGQSNPPITQTLRKDVDIPFVLNEKMTMYVLGEYIGEGRTFFNQTTSAFLQLKRD